MSTTRASGVDGRALVIIPAFREADNIGQTLDELASVRPDLGVVVVDDGSPDDTAAIARSAGARVLRHPFNLGIGGALRTGFRYAMEAGYEVAIQLDADGQHDPTQIVLLERALEAGADMAIGSRFAPESQRYRISPVRLGAMAVLRLVVRHVSGRRFTDTSSGFRAFRRPVIEFFARNYPYEYMESVEALVLAVAAGFEVHEVPIVMRSRRGGEPSNRSLRLPYHYARLLLTIAVSAARRPN